MTVANTTAFAGPYTGNGATTAFSFSFEAAGISEVGVTLNGVVQVSGFTVALNAGGNGGTVTFAVAPANGVEVIPFLNPLFTQDINFTNAGPFLPATHTEGFDRAAHRDIYLNDQAARTFRMPRGKAGLQLTTANVDGVLGVSAAGAAVFLPTVSFVGPIGPAGDVAKVDTRAALAAIIGQAAGAARYLIEAGREGLFVWRLGDFSALVAVDTRQGIYVASATVAATVGAWVRTGWTVIECHWFGLAADNATNDAPAINAAFALAEVLNTFAVDYGLSGLWVHLRMGQYYCAAALVPQQTKKFYGDGAKGDAGGSSTVIRFAAGVHGIDLQYAVGVRSPAIAIEGLHLIGGYTNFASEGEFHGIEADVRFRARDLYIEDFQGDGIHIEATAEAGNSFLENANNFVVEDCWIQTCRIGIYVQGADANAGSIVRLSANSNRRWGVLDICFLGNYYEALHAADNGIWPPAANGVPPSVVSHSGNRYCVVYGQEANASVNAPSGTTADTAYWLYLAAGGVETIALNIPAWSNGMTVRSGGSYYADGSNGGMEFNSCYAETGQGINQFGMSTLVVGGQGMRRHKGTIWADGRGLSAQQFTIDGNLTAYGTVLQLGPESGAVDGLAYLNSSSTNYMIQARSWPGPTNIGSFLFVNGIYYDVNNAGWKHQFRVNGADVALINSTGVDLAAGKVFKIGGTQVVGTQGAAVADPAAITSVDGTNAAAAPTQAEFNALVAEFNKLRTDFASARTSLVNANARLRAHGLYT